MFQLDKGIFLEDKDVLLEWGKPITRLTGKSDGEILKKGDRVIINWGIHKILNGLELDLTNIFLGAPIFFFNKKFTTISSWAVGDNKAKEFFTKVSNHLITLFGAPEKEKINDGREELWVWKTNGAKFVLNLFEQHAFKCVLTIEQNSGGF